MNDILSIMRGMVTMAGLAMVIQARYPQPPEQLTFWPEPEQLTAFPPPHPVVDMMSAISTAYRHTIESLLDPLAAKRERAEGST